jgi:Cu+-exporting ATPase
MTEMFVGASVAHLLPGRLLAWGQLALATPVVLWGGWPFFVRGWASVVNRHLNMFTSVVATLFPDLFPHAFQGHGGGVAVYFEAAAAITTLVLLGQVLELRARSQTSSAIRALLGLAPKTARRGTGSASAQERRCRWTASFLRGPVPWTNPWSPGSRCQWRRVPRAG